jgi:hypothetical protein
MSVRTDHHSKEEPAAHTRSQRRDLVCEAWPEGMPALTGMADGRDW